MKKSIRPRLILLFYYLKPIIPRKLQLFIRQKVARILRAFHKNDWPINYQIKDLPENWESWPERKQFALVLRHDVESLRGISNIWNLVEMEAEMGFKSSFNFSPIS